jgi:dephospho-CoA kinase
LRLSYIINRAQQAAERWIACFIYGILRRQKGIGLFLVALTGGIASGKSTVCRMLSDKGAYILCSDELAREVVERDQPAWKEIVEHFGEVVLDADGKIDRKKLADIVFADAAERVFLEKATHPRIFQRMAEILRDIDTETGGEAVVILDIPLLVEARAGDMFDFNLVVDAPPRIQVERLKAERGSSEEEAWSRINSQVSREERLSCADLVIHNDGDIGDLQREVDEAWEAIIALADKPRQV